jgi:hypothetical protein
LETDIAFALASGAPAFAQERPFLFSVATNTDHPNRRCVSTTISASASVRSRATPAISRSSESECMLARAIHLSIDASDRRPLLHQREAA